MTKPNFLIIGAAKSGTSALYYYLKQHPQVYMSSRKEPHFFSFDEQSRNTRGPGDTVPLAITDPEKYWVLFDGVTNEMAVGEASPTYLYVPGTAERIRQLLPHVKLVAILRHPAERAYSAFMHVVRDGREPITDFEEALREEKRRIQENWGPIWHYVQGGFYHEQLKRYFNVFDDGQIKVYLYEDFKIDAVEVLQDIFRYLGVDDTFVPDVSVKPNVSGIPRSKALQRAMFNLFIKRNPIKMVSRVLIPEDLRWRFTTTLRNENLVKKPMSLEARRQLIEVYREDILALQKLIHRDLSNWLE